MTRRKFIQVLVKAGAGIVTGVLWLARQACGGIARAPRRFVWALPVKRYPGSLKSLGDVSRGGKWSG